MNYSHTQRAPTYLIVLAGALAFGLLGTALPAPAAARVTPLVFSALFLFLAFCRQ